MLALADDRGPFKDSLAFALRLIAFVTLPASVGLILLRVPIVRVLFQGGRFGAADTLETAGALATLSAGLFFFAGIRIVVPAFYLAIEKFLDANIGKDRPGEMTK